MGSGFAKKKKEAKALQAQLSQMQDKMLQTEVTGSAGNGLVTLVLNGEYQLKSLLIKPDCVDPEDVEGLQDLIKSAYADAVQKLQQQSASAMPQMGGSMPNLSMFGL